MISYLHPLSCIQSDSTDYSIVFQTRSVWLYELRVRWPRGAKLTSTQQVNIELCVFSQCVFHMLQIFDFKHFMTLCFWTLPQHLETTGQFPDLFMETEPQSTLFRTWWFWNSECLGARLRFQHERVGEMSWGGSSGLKQDKSETKHLRASLDVSSWKSDGFNRFLNVCAEREINSCWRSRVKQNQPHVLM